MRLDMTHEKQEQPWDGDCRTGDADEFTPEWCPPRRSHAGGGQVTGSRLAQLCSVPFWERAVRRCSEHHESQSPGAALRVHPAAGRSEVKLTKGGSGRPGLTSAPRGAKAENALNTLTKLVLGAMGRLRALPATGEATTTIVLPAPAKQGGLPLMEALASRHSAREFARQPLPLPLLSGLLWAAYGVNRAGGGRTAPSALNAQEVDVYVALPAGAYRYDAPAHALHLVAASDLRRVTGYQDFVDEAPLDLVYVADHARMGMVPVDRRESYASAAAGAIAQNVYLFAASTGLATVIRAWIDRNAIADALGLTHDQQVLLAQTVGYPKP